MSATTRPSGARRAALDLERALFAIAGTVTLGSIALAVTREPLVPARRGRGRRQPVGVRAHRRLPGLARAAPVHRPARVRPLSALGPIGRLGRWSATHARIVFIAWAVVVVGLGVLAPRVETALSGAGWEDSGSQSVAARDLIQRDFAGNASSGLMVVVHSPTLRPPIPRSRRRSREPRPSCALNRRVASVTPAAEGRDDLRRRPHGHRHGRIGGGPDGDGAGPPTT